jgi:D-glycero-D-manno-heptose 1,7-bisphosphate phosphatase
MKKAIFLDRDGTINVEKHYLYKKEDFEFLPRVIEALKMLQDAGYMLIVVTNQSGIARGYYTEQEFKDLNDWMVSTLYTKGVKISNVYYCPHLPDAELENYRKDCECRKPKLGMYIQAVTEYGIDLAQSYAIGDKIRDCAICETTACRGFLIENNEKPSIIADVKAHKFRNVKYCDDLYGCAVQITC